MTRAGQLLGGFPDNLGSTTCPSRSRSRAPFSGPQALQMVSPNHLSLQCLKAKGGKRGSKKGVPKGSGEKRRKEGALTLNPQRLAQGSFTRRQQNILRAPGWTP